MTNTFEHRLSQYRQLEGKIKEMEDAHKATMLPYNDARIKLRALLLQMLQDTGQESAKTAAGTVYKIVKVSASLDDREEFKRHVIGAEMWDLIDWRANKTAVMDYSAMNGGALPPGVKVTQILEIGVRAPASPRKRQSAVAIIAQDENGDDVELEPAEEDDEQTEDNAA